MLANQDNATAEHGPTNPVQTGLSTLINFGRKRMPGGYPVNEVPLPKVRIVAQEDNQNIIRLQTQQQEIETLLMQLRENYATLHRSRAEQSHLSTEHQQTIQKLRSELEQTRKQAQLLMLERDARLALNQERVERLKPAEESAQAGSSRVLEGCVDKETRDSERLQALLQERNSQLAKDREQLREAMKRAAEVKEQADRWPYLRLDVPVVGFWRHRMEHLCKQDRANTWLVLV